MNLASEDVKRDFANGVKNAADVVKFKNLDTDHADVLKYTEALIKKSLAEPIQDETPWVQAMEDAKTALSKSKAKVYQSPSLKNYIQLRQTVNRASDERTIYDNINLANKQKQYQEKLTFKEPRLGEISIEKNRPVDVLALKEDQSSDLRGEYSKKDYSIYRLKGLVTNEPYKYADQNGLFGQLTNEFDNNRFIDSLTAVEQSKEMIDGLCDKYGIKPEIIYSIVFREKYMQSMPDWLCDISSLYGYYEGCSKEDRYFGDHSTGLGAIRPGIARDAWISAGKSSEDVIPKLNVDLQLKLSSDDAFNIETMILVLAMEAKDTCKYIDSYKELGTLTDEQ